MAKPAKKPASKTPGSKEDDDDEEEDPEQSEAEVDIPDDDDDDDGDAGGDGQPAPGAAAKRRLRYKEARDAAEAATKRAEEAEAKARAADERIHRIELDQAELKGRVAAGGRDPSADEIARLRSRKWTLQAQLSQTDDNAIAASLMQQLDEVEDQMDEARAKRRTASQPPPPRVTQEDHEKAALNAEFPWLKSNPAAARFAMGRYHVLAAEKGSDGLAIAREAAQEAAAKFGLAGAPAAPRPSQADKQRHSAPRSGDIGGSSTQRKEGKVHLNAGQVKLAILRYPDLDEDEAVRKWAMMARKRGAI